VNFFPTDFDIGVLVVPLGMGVLELADNGLCLLPHNLELPPSPSQDTAHSHGPRVALTDQFDPVLWHRRFGHLNMQSLQAQHTHGVPTTPVLDIFVKNAFL
jgi:hypothetical protein